MDQLNKQISALETPREVASKQSELDQFAERLNLFFSDLISSPTPGTRLVSAVG
jgi:hypothetical protein